MPPIPLVGYPVLASHPLMKMSFPVSLAMDKVKVKATGF